MQLRDGSTAADPRLDRLVEFDERSRAFSIRQAPRVAGRTDVRSYRWGLSTWLDQGSEGACVGFAITHELAARPAVVDHADAVLARSIYRQAQLIDPWPGESYDGTSVLAGIKIAQQAGYFAEYRWGFGIDDVLLGFWEGPIVLGLPWLSGMFVPDADGFIHATGSLAGGHAILARGARLVRRAGAPSGRRLDLADVDRERSYVELHNSWGRDWGVDGRCRISVSDLARLLADDGEACVPMLRKRG